MAKGEYLYCIIPRENAPKKFDLGGFDGTEVRSLGFKDLTAVVSETPVMEYDPTEELTQKHRDVALEMLKKHSVLPVAFGMVFRTTGILFNTMRQTYTLLKMSLGAVDGKIELGVKVVLPKEKAESLVGDEFEALRKQCQTEFEDYFSGIAEKTKPLKLFSDRLAANQAFLVKKTRLGEFTDAVEELRKKHSDLKIQYTGPWPAYNFVDVHIMKKG